MSTSPFSNSGTMHTAPTWRRYSRVAVCPSGRRTVSSKTCRIFPSKISREDSVRSRRSMVSAMCLSPFFALILPFSAGLVNRMKTVNFSAYDAARGGHTVAREIRSFPKQECRFPYTKGRMSRQVHGAGVLRKSHALSADAAVCPAAFASAALCRSGARQISPGGGRAGIIRTRPPPSPAEARKANAFRASFLRFLRFSVIRRNVGDGQAPPARYTAAKLIAPMRNDTHP